MPRFFKRNGVQVLMSRTSDEYDPLTDEIKECNAFNPDLALDTHNNAGEGTDLRHMIITEEGQTKL